MTAQTLSVWLWRKNVQALLSFCIVILHNVQVAACLSPSSKPDTEPDSLPQHLSDLSEGLTGQVETVTEVVTLRRYMARPRLGQT